MSLDKQLLAMLACPACKNVLVPVNEEQGLLCERCVRVYPIRDEIPIMLVEEAVPLADWNRGERLNAIAVQHS